MATCPRATRVWDDTRSLEEDAMTIRHLTTAAAVAALLLGSAAVPAVAKDSDVIRRGDCSGRADWKLKVGPDDGRLEVEGEVDSNHPGQVWRWRFKHNGVVVASGTRTTGGASGSFEVRRLMKNRSGTDTIVFRARRPATGQVCRGVVTF
jgi:hypothetical protein